MEEGGHEKGRLSSAASRGRLRTHPRPARLALLARAMDDTGIAYEAWGTARIRTRRTDEGTGLQIAGATTLRAARSALWVRPNSLAISGGR